MTRLAPILDYIKDDKKIIFDMADILTINYKNAWNARGLSIKWKLIYSLEYFLIKQQEKRLILKKFPKLLVSQRDYDYAMNNFNGDKSNLKVLPNHVPNLNLIEILEKAKKNTIKRESNEIFKICFIGNMDAQHNHSSILSFIKSKIIHKLNKDNVSFTIIGKMNKQKEYFIKKLFRCNK